MVLNTIIVEDEPLSRIYLANLLSQFCPEVNVLAKVGNAHEAINAIEEFSPDLVFLDIELHGGTGFEVLKTIVQPAFHAIFTTALDHHAIKIIKLSGVDFLQKPIDVEELQAVIGKVLQNRHNGNCTRAINYLVETLNNDHTPVHINLNTGSENEYAKIRDIIRIEGTDSICTFTFRAGIAKTVHNNLKGFDNLLKDMQFLRIHSNHIINLNEIISLENEFIVMSDKIAVPVSARKLEEIKGMLKV